MGEPPDSSAALRATEVDDDEEAPEDRTMPLSIPVAVLGPSRDTEPHSVVAPLAESDRYTLTVVSGAEAGRVFTLPERGCTIGRGPDQDLSIDDSAVSRAHARITRGAAGPILEDLDSTNGTYVDSARVRRAVLKSGDLIQLGARVVLRLTIVDRVEEALQHRLYETSTKDALTGTYNRAYLGERLLAELAIVRRHGTALSLLLVDIDRFKLVNDTHGHLVGDEVLAAVAGRIRGVLRVEDVVARFGGEEFVVLLRATDLEGAARLAERLRLAVASAPIAAPDTSLEVTISIGVAAASELEAGQGLTELFALADARLYGAKAAGRNRVAAAGQGLRRPSGATTEPGANAGLSVSRPVAFIPKKS